MRQVMQRTITRKRIIPLHRWAPAGAEMEQPLNLVVIYEDAATCKWARQTCEAMCMEGGKESVHRTWWKLGELRQPAVLAGAVSKAMRADVIVVAVRATEGFPLPFYVWVRSWLPHRLQATGMLVAMFDTPEQGGFRTSRAVEYLRGVARRAQMSCLVNELNLAQEASRVPEGQAHTSWPIVVRHQKGSTKRPPRQAPDWWRMAA